MNKKEFQELMLLFSAFFSALQQVVDQRLSSLEEMPEEGIEPKRERGIEESVSVLPEYDTCFFITKGERTYGACMSQLSAMLNCSSKQAKVLRKLFGVVGRDWFDLVERDVDEIERLLSQFPSRCGPISKSMIKKILTEFRPEIERQCLGRLRHG